MAPIEKLNGEYDLVNSDAGFLIAETDSYDITGLTEEEIAAASIIDYAAVVDQDRGIRMKVATLVADELTLLSAPQLLAFKEYMERVKDAGVKLRGITPFTPELKEEVVRLYKEGLIINDIADNCPEPFRSKY